MRSLLVAGQDELIGGLAKRRLDEYRDSPPTRIPKLRSNARILEGYEITKIIPFEHETPPLRMLQQIVRG